jgi:hypothetical protein
MIVAENRCRFFRSCANGTLQLMLMTAMRRATWFGRENAPLNFAARIAALLHCSLVLATSANFTTPMSNAGANAPVGNGGQKQE